MLRDKLAAIITPLIVLLNGGMGWMLLFEKAGTNEGGLFGVLMDLPPSFTVIPETTWRWGNAISALLVPQRGFLMGLPLATIVFTQWWLATDKTRQVETTETGKKTRSTSRPTNVWTEDTQTRFPIATRRMIAAGVAAGLLPLVHAHSFVVVMGMAACLVLIQMRWREWFAFFAVASVIAIPQLLWSTMHSAVDASSFFCVGAGMGPWRGEPDLFLVQEHGNFYSADICGSSTEGDGYLVPRRVLLFYLPFTLCFIVPNFVKMAPWIWDNIKVLFYWWLASAPLVALLLVKLWRQGPIPTSYRRAAVCLRHACGRTRCRRHRAAFEQVSGLRRRGTPLC